MKDIVYEWLLEMRSYVESRSSSDVGNIIMLFGYTLRYAVGVEPPFSSAVVLVGNLCLVFDMQKDYLSDSLTNQFLNTFCFVTNVLVFLHDFYMYTIRQRNR